MNKNQVAQFSLLATVFTLPFSTMLIFTPGEINGTPWPMGNLGIFLFEIFLLVYLTCRIDRLAALVRNNLLATVLLVGYLVLEVVFSARAPVALLSSLRLLLAFVLIALLSKEELPEKAPHVWLLALIFPALFTVAQIFFGFESSNVLFGVAAHPVELPGTSVVEIDGLRQIRAYGTFPHPNIFAAFLVLSLFYFLTCHPERSRGIATGHDSSTRMRSLGMTILGFLLGLTFSRGAILVAAVLAVLVWWKRQKSCTHVLHDRKKRACNFFVAGVLLAVAIFPQAYFTRISGQGSLETRSTQERLASLSDGLRLFDRSPWLGVGPGAAVPALAALKPGWAAWHYEPPHALPLLLLVEYGIFGLAILLWLVVRWFKTLPRQSKNITTALLAVILGLGFFDHAPLTSAQLLLSEAILLGIVSRYARDAEQY